MLTWSVHPQLISRSLIGVDLCWCFWEFRRTKWPSVSSDRQILPVTLADMFKASTPRTSLPRSLEGRRKFNLASVAWLSFSPYLVVTMETKPCWRGVLTGGLVGQTQRNPRIFCRQCMQGKSWKKSLAQERNLRNKSAVCFGFTGFFFWFFKFLLVMK